MSCLNRNLGNELQQGVWHHSDVIHNLEARPLTNTCVLLGIAVSVSEYKVLLLGDTLAVTVSFISRRRARHFRFVCQLCRMCAVGLPSGLKFVFDESHQSSTLQISITENVETHRLMF